MQGAASLASRMLDIVLSPSPSARADARVEHCKIGASDHLPTRTETRVPWVGEHTDEVLAAELGLSDGELSKLAVDGVISRGG